MPILCASGDQSGRFDHVAGVVQTDPLATGVFDDEIRACAGRADAWGFVNRAGGPDFELNVVFPRGRVLPPKVRAFVDFLVEQLDLGPRSEPTS